MRVRLIIIFTIPIAALFVALGAAYAGGLASSEQQELYLDRLNDASHFVLSARQSLLADDPTVLAGELQRYGNLYGIRATVLDRSGGTWATNGLDVSDIDQRFAALAGRRAALDGTTFPWQYGDLIVAEPVFDGGDLIGAVVTSSDTGRLARKVLLQWGALGLVGLVAIGLSVLIASTLATWVLRPVRAVETAIGEVWRGQLDARIPEASGPPELKQVIAGFNSMAAKVEGLMHKQREFVSNASHELRNPLNALLLRVEDLALAVPPERAEEADQVRAEGRRMAGILDGLLLLARGEDVGAPAEPVDVVPLVTGRAELWRTIAADRGIAVNVNAQPEAWALVDPLVVESAFDAVADNAVKFSPAEAVVDVSVEHDDGFVAIAVHDRGPGIPAGEIEKVTDRFWRSPEHGDVRGSGLGLAIAADLLDSSGGDLEVSPRSGGGLRVTLRVPSAGAEP